MGSRGIVRGEEPFAWGKMARTPKIVVIGLGYVGLPPAVALATRYDTAGLDIDELRIGELKRGEGRTREIDAKRLLASSLPLTSDPRDTHAADVYIVTVPTPVDAANRPARRGESMDWR